MALHQFVHLGDLHLGPNSRNADRLRALDQAISEGLQLPHLAAWLWPGDLNHGRMTIEDRNALLVRVILMASKAPVVICYGNHDLPGDLDFLVRLDTTFPVFVIATPQVLRVQLATGKWAAIFVLPYPTRAGLVAAGTPSDAIVDAAKLALDAIFLDAAARLEERAAAGDLPLMIGHVNVAGAIASSGQPNIGREIELDAALLDRLGPIYIGLNHIHKAQEIEGAFYAGSMCRLDWGEVEEKRYLVVTYGPGGWGGHAGDGPWNGDQRFTWDIDSKPLNVAPMYHVEGELTREGFDWTCNDGGEAEQAGPGFFTGAEVRVRYRFNADEKSALDEAIVRAPFEGAKRLELDPIAVRNRAVRAPEVAAAQTLEQKLEAYVRNANLTWSPSLQAKLTALQNPDGAAFLTQVHQQLSALRQPDGHAPSSDLPVDGAEHQASADSVEEFTL